jgi:uncharacterized protein YycO
MIGDLLFVRNTGFFGEKIREVTGGEFDHVALVITDNLMIEALPFRGVAIKNKRRYRNNYTRTMRLKDRTPVAGMIEFALSKVGCLYDWTLVLSLWYLIVSKAKQYQSPIDSKNAFMCSELIMSAGEYAGVKILDGKREWVTPSDLMKSNLLMEVV